MSNPAVPRLKERGGAAVKINAGGGKTTPASSRSISTGKENSRPTSRIRAATQKPNMRPIARIDKPAAAAPPAVLESRAEPRARKSTSSVPRGRSCSPSSFSGDLSNLKKNSTRVPAGLSQRRVSGSKIEYSGEKSNLEKRVAKDLGKRGENLKDLQENEKNSNLAMNSINEVNIENSSLKTNEASHHDNVMEICSLEEVKVKSFGVESESGSGTGNSKMVGKVSNFPGMPSESGGNKYPSKIREKLAFLEGKVKRIASDIKRTKEMLDMNNPDSSKMILSDIREKISGIENAMGYSLYGDGAAKMGLVETEEVEDEKIWKELIDAKEPVKGSNCEELEARLLPHHKLIRDRTLLKTSGVSNINGIQIRESSSELNAKDMEASYFDDSAIAKAFNASLSKDEPKVDVDTSELQEMDDAVIHEAGSSSLNLINANTDAMLMADEKLDDFDDEEKPLDLKFEDVIEDSSIYQLNDISCKTSTGGWFVSEGESVLLAHDDASCSFYDIANCEEKKEYKPPTGISPSIWQDCWIIRAPNADGCSGRYVVAASAGNSVASGFCSWDFYSGDIRAFHFDHKTTPIRTSLASLSNNIIHKRNVPSMFTATDNIQWWYKPCGPLITSTASGQRMVNIYDIRDGDSVMKWELQKPVLSMDYASPLQWRNRGKVVIAETDSISLWDVSSLSPQPLLSVPSGRNVTALHVNNTDAEFGGGIRHRVSSSEAEGNDGIFCTPDYINVLDFRQPSGIGLKIPKVGVDVQSSFSSGDSIYIGCTNLRSTARKQTASHIQQFSMRNQKLFCCYTLPESNANSNFTALNQVWGNSNITMGVCGLGLFVFDSDGSQPFPMVNVNTQNAREVIGPDNMCSPSFDFSSSRVLLISRDRPAKWRFLL